MHGELEERLRLEEELRAAQEELDRIHSQDGFGDEEVDLGDSGDDGHRYGQEEDAGFQDQRAGAAAAVAAAYNERMENKGDGMNAPWDDASSPYPPTSAGARRRGRGEDSNNAGNVRPLSFSSSPHHVRPPSVLSRSGNATPLSVSFDDYQRLHSESKVLQKRLAQEVVHLVTERDALAAKVADLQECKLDSAREMS